MKYFLKGYRALGRFLRNRERKLDYGIMGYECIEYTDIFERLTCLYCNRTIPYEKHRTKNGCLWCDWKYWEEKE